MSAIKKVHCAKNRVKRYDFSRGVKAPGAFFKWLTGIVAGAGLVGHKITVNKGNLGDLKPPFLVLGTHHSYLDLKTMVKAFPKAKITYVCSLDVLTMHSEWLLGNLGIIYKRKFVQDVHLLRNMRRAVKELKNCILVLYPEAKFSLDGTTSYLPPTLGKLSKFLGAPVVVANMHGNYVSQPQWNRGKEKEPRIKKKTPLTTDLTLIADENEVRELSADELRARIEKAMQYDDFAWQKANGIKISDPRRAEGLHKLLYKCAHCGKEFDMSSALTHLRCNSCGSEWEMDEYGELHGVNCDTVYAHIPDWFDYEQASVRKEVEEGTYRFDKEVRLCTLPYKRLYDWGTARFVQTAEGSTITGRAYGEPLEMHWKGNASNGMHIEYNYLKVADAFALSTLDETYWCFTDCDGTLTKLSLATDEIYRRSCKPDDVPITGDEAEVKIIKKVAEALD